MNTLKLGSTDAQVSQICLGCMNMGTRQNEEKSFALLDAYVEAGGSFLDTANNYAVWNEGGKGGESELVMGKWMKERGNRDQLFIASKVGFNVPGPGQTWDDSASLSAQTIQQECEGSLKRMGIDTIDLYYAHVDHRPTPMEETLEAFDRLVKAGKVRYLGASNYLAARLERAHWISSTNGWAEYCCVQQKFSYLRPKPGADFGIQVNVNADLLDYVRNNDMTTLAYSPLLSGSYTNDAKSIPDQFKGPDSDARLAALAEVADAHGATRNQVVFAWMLQGAPPIIPVVGASSLEQLTENLGAADLTLTKEQVEKLTNAGS
jgi:aryl-alcohol dehydrogenase-like predicted oxidoreductase